MHHLLYLSTASSPFTEPQLRTLLRQMRAANVAAGISGLLVYGQGHFLQLLEGEQVAVQQMFRRVRRDPRHSEVSLLYDHAWPGRIFESFHMAWNTQPPPTEPGQLPLNLAAVSGRRGYASPVDTLHLFAHQVLRGGAPDPSRPEQ